MAATGWTFSELDAQDVDDVNGLLEWLRIRSAVKKQMDAMR